MRIGKDRLKADGLLLITAIIWGVAFIFQRMAASEITPFFFNGIRYPLGSLVLLPFIGEKILKTTRKEILGGLLAGGLMAGGAGLQQAGLQFTSAGKAGFITGLYVVLVPIFLAIFWKQRPSNITWIASVLAAIGLFFLSITNNFRLAPGDGLEFIGAFLWAFHVIIIGILAPKVNILRLAFIQYLFCGFFSLLMGFMFEPISGIVFNSNTIMAILYTGILSTGVGYTFQALGQKNAPASDAAIIMSGEAVFAALSGWLFLNELLEPRQLAGCLIILAAMLLAQYPGKHTEPE
ncbi:MAG: DMT family transporter [Anaerolineales bacterium]|nr:DMT family transporter [Anaerolineales bacterium]